jgi:hypothetical protein
MHQDETLQEQADWDAWQLSEEASSPRAENTIISRRMNRIFFNGNTGRTDILENGLCEGCW